MADGADPGEPELDYGDDDQYYEEQGLEGLADKGRPGGLAADEDAEGEAGLGGLADGAQKLLRRPWPLVEPGGRGELWVCGTGAACHLDVPLSLTYAWAPTLLQMPTARWARLRMRTSRSMASPGSSTSPAASTQSGR